MRRIDQPHTQIGSPQPIAFSDETLQEMISLLQQNEPDLVGFAELLNQYPPVLGRVIQAANSAASGKWNNITDPAHAVSYLGSRRLIQLLVGITVQVSAAE